MSSKKKSKWKPLPLVIPEGPEHTEDAEFIAFPERLEELSDTTVELDGALARALQDLELEELSYDRSNEDEDLYEFPDLDEDNERVQRLYDRARHLTPTISGNTGGSKGLSKKEKNEQIWRRFASLCREDGSKDQQAMRVLDEGGKKALELRDGYQRTPLIYAAQYGSPNLVRMLLASGAHLNARDGTSGKLTALHTAAFLGRPELCIVLIDAGGDAALPDAKGSTALEHFCKKGHAEVRRAWAWRRRCHFMLMLYACGYRRNKQNTSVKQSIGVDQFQDVVDLFRGCDGGGAPDSAEAEHDCKRLVFSCERIVRLIAMFL